MQPNKTSTMHSERSQVSIGETPIATNRDAPSHDEAGDGDEALEDFDIDTIQSHIVGLDELDDVSPRQSSHAHVGSPSNSESREPEKDESGDNDSEEKDQNQKQKQNTDDTSPESPPQDTVTKMVFTTLWKLFQSALIVMTVFIGLMSIFWGSLYKRETRYHNLNMLVVIGDTGVVSGGETLVPPLVGDSFRKMLELDPVVKTLGHYDFVDIKDISDSGALHNRTVAEEIRELVVKKYWVAFYILPNATETIYSGFANANALYANQGAYKSLITAYYESGRHFSALSQYVLKNLFTTEHTWLLNYVRQDIYGAVIGNLTGSEKAALAGSTAIAPLYAARPAFNQVDLRPAPLPAVLGPSEIGLIYALVFSFHQINFSLEIYGKMRPLLKFPQFLMWRFLASQLNCAVLALVYCLTTIAFQVPVNVAFGRLGFLVFWLIMYLFMAACGALNEFALTQILAYGTRALIPVWMVFSIVANISPVFAPFELTPGFYKYGYAMPMFNAYSALKVVFFDVSKSSLGRNLGILVAWLVVFQLLVSLLYILKERSERKARRLRIATAPAPASSS